MPPGGWTYKVKETDTVIDGQNLRELTHRVIDHLLSNGLEISPIQDQIIEDEICQRLPPGRCRIPPTEQEKMNPERTTLTFSQAMAGTKTIARWLMRGAKKVGQEEADARAKICSSCSLNKPVTGCASCAMNKIRQLAGEVIGSRKTASDNLLNVCISCGCMLKASVWLPLDIQQRHIPPELNDSLPDHCWKKRK